MNDDALKRSAAARAMLQDGAPEIVQAVRAQGRGLAKTERAVLEILYGARLRVTAITAVSLSSSAGLSAVTWTDVEQDTAGMWNASAPTGIVARVPGDYMMGAGIHFAAAAGGRRGLSIRLNAAAVPGLYQTIAGTSDGPVRLSVHGYVTGVQSDDIISVGVFQNSGGAINISSAAFWIMKM